MTTLTDFLLARIAEDEAAARAAMTVHQRRVKNLGDGKWGSEYYEPIPADEVRRDVVCSIPPGQSSPGDSWSDKPGTALFERFHPARVLAECAAKRQIVELHQPLDNDPEPFCWNCDEETWPCKTMAALALPYADHPEFQEEWKP